MHFFPIVPVGNLDLASFSNHHLVLYGLMDISEYANYYEERRRKGNYIVLDCGGFEKDGVDYKDFMECAKRLNAQELQVPDFAGDVVETLRRMNKFLSEININDLQRYELQVVPQGVTLKQYMDCLWNQIRLLQLSKVPVKTEDLIIGLSKVSAVDALSLVTKVPFNYVNRPITIEKVHYAYPHNKLHLLGLHDPLELFHYVHNKYIRGVDTSTPISHALAACFYSERYEFPEYPTYRHLPRVDLRGTINSAATTVVKENLAIVNKICSEVGEVALESEEWLLQ